MRLKVFVDTAPFVAFLNSKDINHKSALEQFDKIAMTKEIFFTSDYVLDEVLSFVTRKKPEFVLHADKLIQESANIRMLKVDDEILANSKMFLKKYPKLLLSLTDWTSAVLARQRSIEKIYSYDSGFDQLKNVKEFRSLRNFSRVEVI